MAKEWLIIHSLLHIELIKVKYNLIIGKYINQSHQTNMQTQEIIHLL